MELFSYGNYLVMESMGLWKVWGYGIYEIYEIMEFTKFTENSGKNFLEIK